MNITEGVQLLEYFSVFHRSIGTKGAIPFLASNAIQVSKQPRNDSRQATSQVKLLHQGRIP